MTKVGQIYKCEVCGNIVEVTHAGKGELVCCGQPMVLMEEQTADFEVEKHVPYIERQENGYLVRIGKNQLHPMTEEHYIEWIELIADGVMLKKFLDPGDQPEAFFEIPEAADVAAREYCNIHGLWAKR